MIPPGEGKTRGQWFLHRYGITLDERDAMIRRQGGICAACGDREAQVVDHCHEAGHVRGMLCRRCNVAMIAIDTDGLLDKLLKYKGLPVPNQQAQVR